MTHGALQARNRTDASTIPPSDDLPSCLRRYHTHNPDAGRNDKSDVLLRVATPHKNPNMAHGFHPSFSSNSRVSRKRLANSNAERLVSQTTFVDQNIT